MGKNRFFILPVLYFSLALTGSISATEDVSSSLTDCKNALNSSEISYFHSAYYSSNDIKIDEEFLRILKDVIEKDDEVLAELVFKKCIDHVETFEYLGKIVKPGDFAINYAAQSGAEKVIQMLINNKVNVNAVDKNSYGSTPLHSVARLSGSLRQDTNPRSQIYVNIAKILIQNNANISAKDDFGETPLHKAAKTGGEEIAKMLIEKGSDINSKSLQGYTPIHISGEFDKVIITKLLIEKGADISIRNDKGLTPLLFAAVCGGKNVLKVLIDNKADINTKDNNGNTAVHLIVDYRKSNISYYVDVIRFLIENHVDTNIRNNEGKTACEIAKEKNKDLLIPVLGCEA